MNKDLQLEKIKYKLRIINDLIDALVDYNGIEGYENKKKFTISIDYETNNNKDKYYYDVKILRGVNRPKEIFNTRFIYTENILEILISFINKFINSDNFLYTSFTRDIYMNKDSKYNINLKNDVTIAFNIKNAKDLATYKTIEQEFIKKTVIMSEQNKFSKSKDVLQLEKAYKIINIVDRILISLSEYNSIVDYNNKKPFNLRVSNHCDAAKKCYVYNFSIIRGNLNPETLLNLRVSIKDNKVIYNLLLDLINKYKQSDNYLYETLNLKNYPINYKINLKNSVSIQLNINNEQDKIVYTSFMDNMNDQKGLKVLQKKKDN